MTTTTLLQIPINTPHTHVRRKPIISYPSTAPKVAAFHQKKFKLRALKEERWWGERRERELGFVVGEEGLNMKKRVILVRFNQGFGFNGGGDGDGGGGGGNNNLNARVVGNLVLAILLTYFTMNGQLGWLLDAIVSIWLIVVLVPIVGLGAFLWWAGRDIVQSSCPNCGNEFQIFKSTLNEELQLCPYCSQPFSVVDDKFVRESVRFSNESTPFEQAFSDIFPGSKKGKDSSGIVDVEAEIKDVD